MRINQRGNITPATPTTQNMIYPIDRFIILNEGSTVSYFQRSIDTNTTPALLSNSNFIFRNCIQLRRDTAGAGDDYVAIEQAIEGFNISDLLFGTSSASPITLSFWLYTDMATGDPGLGQYHILVRNGNNTQYYFANYTISASNTWQYITLTIPGCTVGTWDTTTSIGLAIRFMFAANSSKYRSTASYNSWHTPSSFLQDYPDSSKRLTSGKSVWITGVQLEKGSVATPFEFRPYPIELQLCQRYCQLRGNGILGRLTSDLKAFQSGFSIVPPMRSTTITASKLTPTSTITFGVLGFQDQTTDSGASIAISPAGKYFAIIWSTPFTGAQSGAICIMYNDIILSSEF